MTGDRRADRRRARGGFAGRGRSSSRSPHVPRFSWWARGPSGC